MNDQWRWEARVNYDSQRLAGHAKHDRAYTWQPVWTQFANDDWKKYHGTLEECVTLVNSINQWWFNSAWQFRITNGKEEIPMELFG